MWLSPITINTSIESKTNPKPTPKRKPTFIFDIPIISDPPQKMNSADYIHQQKTSKAHPAARMEQPSWPPDLIGDHAGVQYTDNLAVIHYRYAHVHTVYLCRRIELGF